MCVCVSRLPVLVLFAGWTCSSWLPLFSGTAGQLWAEWQASACTQRRHSPALTFFPQHSFVTSSHSAVDTGAGITPCTAYIQGRLEPVDAPGRTQLPPRRREQHPTQATWLSCSAIVPASLYISLEYSSIYPPRPPRMLVSPARLAGNQSEPHRRHVHEHQAAPCSVTGPRPPSLCCRRHTTRAT